METRLDGQLFVERYLLADEVANETSYEIRVDAADKLRLGLLVILKIKKISCCAREANDSVN